MPVVHYLMNSIQYEPSAPNIILLANHLVIRLFLPRDDMGHVGLLCESRGLIRDLRVDTWERYENCHIVIFLSYILIHDLLYLFI